MVRFVLQSIGPCLLLWLLLSCIALAEYYDCSISVGMSDTVLSKIFIKIVYIMVLTNCGLVTPYGNEGLGQHCLTAPSHYLNQCWLIVNKFPWHSSEGILYEDLKTPFKEIRLICVKIQLCETSHLGQHLCYCPSGAGQDDVIAWSTLLIMGTLCRESTVHPWFPWHRNSNEELCREVFVLITRKNC